MVAPETFLGMTYAVAYSEEMQCSIGMSRTQSVHLPKRPGEVQCPGWRREACVGKSDDH